ncbi:glycine/betaine ABC transporter [Alkalihalobacillus alcalophilus ATCC 27647 = CGMCC 1.3604]|uniref:Glycine betaine/L-proline transporter n=1 Tax=Alkalihalobacillus alcalophilus ATCC 27647 = CGMCC 1.3604 TaxID=1218173 RepID=J8TFG5_ALKAL|nr:proline/glycine betaine ABC transporter permease [Alkalihalobacillus alcalophilus]AFV25644.1 glycine betaine/L-proline transporter [Alkalihalobacillus alcalophilus ATCC 27647 = CGMCC 1.3604]KGA98796.1 glycine/betaine ABC transporter [Alkalihalobacillus alcalophilus ATCC 27647 = CGMCC 1.3604]MED1560979.1 proline/glycine betaine ABC transporter permease [Alkalihalobacillus alcalophilus]THG88650.1 glycine/betaine ABC transporter [Alkalihalobacillus alcalophilus ATCC 27647 = CGMCC 1.3604]
MDSIPRLPLAEWIDSFVDWLKSGAAFFEAIRTGIGALVDFFEMILAFPPAWLFILLVVALTVFLNRKKWGLPVFVLLGLLLIYNLGYWNGAVQTLSLVLTSAFIALIIGIPLGIWMSKSKIVESILKPVLDLMQTMPAFVYLIPAVAFFGIGMVPGVVASVIFAMPPTVRLTNLGIKQVSTELIEAADAFGSTPAQKLFKVELPMAKGTIMAGVNQSIMLALSMVVIAAMIGARGLGQEVYYAVGQNNVGKGFETGIAIVIIAIILDRLTQSFNANKKEV